jgi:fructokinase
VVGDALIDELRDDSGSRDFPGGAALNVAIGLAVLGLNPTLIAMVGVDEAGDRLREHLDRYGVTLIASPSALGSSRAVSERLDGEPHYFFNSAAQNRTLLFDQATLIALDTADLIVVSCFPFDNEDQYRRLKAAVSESQRRVLVDGNPRAGMMSDRDRFLTNFTEFAAKSLVCKVGDDDASLLANESLAAFVNRLQTAGATTILATEGPHGASVQRPGHSRIHAGIVDLPGEIVDTMGGGDATLASIVHTIATRGIPQTDTEWTTALEAAMVIAAATCRADGALLRVAS